LNFVDAPPEWTLWTFDYGNEKYGDYDDDAGGDDVDDRGFVVAVDEELADVAVEDVVVDDKRSSSVDADVNVTAVVVVVVE
jgi:hypothetical protein